MFGKPKNFPIELFVSEYSGRYGYENVVINLELMKKSGLKDEDIVEVKFDDKSYFANCKGLDIDPQEIWISPEAIKLHKIPLDSKVIVSKINYKNAKKMILEPLTENFPPVTEEAVKRSILGYPFRKNDLFDFPYFEKLYPLRVIGVEPSNDVLKVHEKTEVYIGYWKD